MSLSDSIFGNILDSIEEIGLDNNANEADLLKGEELNIIEFTESPNGLNQKLRPAQAVILKLFYGIPLSDTIPIEDVELPPTETQKIILRHPITGYTVGPLSEKGYLEYLLDTGKTNGIQNKKYTTLILNIGRRAGKSTMSSIVGCYELYRLLRKYSPQKYYNIRENARIRIIVVGTDKPQSEDLFEAISSYAQHSPYLSKYIARNIQNKIAFYTPSDLDKARKTNKDPRPTLQITPTGCSASGLRGPNTIEGIMDEVAHMKDQKSKKASAESVYEALEPSVSTFADGKMVLISTPNGPSGFFYDMSQIALKDPKGSMLYVQAPTWEINPGRVSDSSYQTKFKLSSSSFKQEYGADFTSSLNDYIEDFDVFSRNLYVPSNSKVSLEGCLGERPVLSKGKDDTQYYFSADLGIKKDWTCFSVGHPEVDRYGNKKIIVDNVFFYKPGDPEWSNSNGYLSYKKMVAETKRICDSFNIIKGIFDQYQSMSYKEELDEYNLDYIQELFVTDKNHSEAFSLFRTLYVDERLEIPAFPELVDHFRNLEISSKGVGDNAIIKVEASYGNHDDIADSVVNLVYLIFKEAFLGESITAQDIRKDTSKKSNKVILSLKHNSNMYSRSLRSLKKGFGVKDSFINKRVR